MTNAEFNEQFRRRTQQFAVGGKKTMLTYKWQLNNVSPKHFPKYMVWPERELVMLFYNNSVLLITQYNSG
jgi:hypothetical protein